EKFLNQSEKYLVQYHGVDATNYFSMRDALKDVHGKICIITDGLLGHFNCDDLKIFCGNIHRLLMKFGGCWYTTDSHFTALMSKTYAAITGKDENVMTNATARGRKKVGEFDKNETVFTNGTFDERRKFLEGSGFTVESFRYPDKINFIPSLKDNPDLMKKVLASYKDIEFWQLTAKATDSTEKNFDIPFAQNFSVKDNILFIKISGRLDTITAPKFLQRYEEYQAEKNFTEIQIDAAELEYISYAGLRVFKIMCESLKDKNLFKIKNSNDEVKKILKENNYTNC
ncbi:MAG: anti-sigma factor antagonist, partial [Selenomonadaceae bacterium]|nr:anti-sigma factor antagonist [Selenomonadaceae bacterium]